MNDNQNPGSFMSGPMHQPGLGPEMQALMNQSPNSGIGSPLNQNSTNPNAPQLAQAPQGSAMPQGMPGGAPLQGGELAIAMNALAGYIKAHGNAHESANGVPIQKAYASLIASQGQPQGGQ